MATLKISDLSVGDWVEYEGLHYPITFVGYGEGGDGSLVNLIRPDLSCFTCKISDIHPIPITAEILEKNGLYRHEIDGDNPQIVVLSDYFMMARMYDDVEWWRVLIYDEELPSKDLFNGIVYSVHQLQHALRLAGVDKEINL